MTSDEWLVTSEVGRERQEPPRRRPKRTIENRTIDGRMQLQIFHRFIDRHKPDGLARLLAMLNDANPNQRAF